MELHSYHISYRLTREDGSSYYGSSTMTTDQPMTPKILEEARDGLYGQLSKTFPETTGLIIIAFTKFEVPM